eukprot:g19257.t1
MHPGWGGRPGYDPRLSGFMVPPIPPVPGIPVAPPSIAAPIPVMLPSPPGVPLAATPTVVPPSFTATGRPTASPHMSTATPNMSTPAASASAKDRTESRPEPSTFETLHEAQRRAEEARSNMEEACPGVRDQETRRGVLSLKLKGCEFQDQE